MKYNKLFFAILLFTIHFSLFTASAQSWQELMDSTNYYRGKQNYQTALVWVKKALPQAEKEFGKMDTNYVSSISTIVEIYFNLGKLDSAFYYQEIHYKLSREVYKTDHPDLANSINNTAYFFHINGNYSESEVLYKEAIEMKKRLYNGKDHPDLLMSLMNYSKFLIDIIGNYKLAEVYFKEAFDMSKRLFNGKDHIGLVASLNNMGYFYSKIGNYKQAEPLLKEAVEICRRIYKSDNYYLASSIQNLGVYYATYKGEDKLAEPLYIEANDMYRRLFKSDNSDLARSINVLAAYYGKKGNFKKSETLITEAYEMRRRLFKNLDHPDLANSIVYMADFLFYVKKEFTQAELLYKEALNMRRRIFKYDHPELALSINFMATFYDSRNDYNNAEPLFYELMTVCYNLFINYISSLSEKEKGEYFNTFSGYYRHFNNYAVSRFKESPKLLETMFDNQLLTKAMLLSASNKVRNRIHSSNETSLIQLFNSWKDKKEYISKQYQLSNAQLKQKNINLDSIINSANEQEKELTNRSEIFGQEYDKKKLTWKDVQNSLGKYEAVVEIVRFNHIEKSRTTDTVYYATLIVKKNSKVPELVLLKNDNELENEYISNYYKSIQNQIDDISSYEQFWKQIAARLKGIKKVFVSPDGVYNQLNLLMLQNPKTKKYVFDEIDVQVVGSSRDLVERKMDTRFRGNDTLPPVVELFGDPLFNLDSTKHLELASAIAENRTRDFYYLGNTLDSTTRGGIRPLPATRTEIEQIASEFTMKGWKVNSHLGEKALEEAVKGVDNPKVLHIATHGKFLKDVEVKDDDRMLGMETKRVAENPLLRSFLLFSGAENTLNNEKLDNQNTDDGLLTAYEAMNLNLDNTELVVLSACETGLGEIKNGEGVYGLQRAFQQAGAKSIIMSLWTVPDKETQELMTSFYSKWLNGKDKRTAFNEARNEMRDKYHYPYYWGGFVMVGE